MLLQSPPLLSLVALLVAKVREERIGGSQTNRDLLGGVDRVLEHLDDGRVGFLVVHELVGQRLDGSLLRGAARSGLRAAELPSLQPRLRVNNDLFVKRERLLTTELREFLVGLEAALVAPWHESSLAQGFRKPCS